MQLYYKKNELKNEIINTKNILNVETLKSFHLRLIQILGFLETNQRYPLLSLLFNTILDVLARAVNK